MKTNDFKLRERCFRVLAAIEPGEWVSSQYVAAAAMFPPEKVARTGKGCDSNLAAQCLKNLWERGVVSKRKKEGTAICEYQLTEKGWQLARECGFVNQEAK